MLQTLLQALACPSLQVMTPAGIGRIKIVSFTSLGAKILVKVGKANHELGETQVVPILKGFQDFRNEVMNGISPVIETINSRLTAKIGPHVAHGLLELPLPADGQLGIQSPIQFEGNDFIEATDLGWLRISETFELYWQPSTNHLRADVDSSKMGWVPLQLFGLSAWLHSQGYAAEMPKGQTMSPAYAKLLQDDASKRTAFFTLSSVN